MQIWHPHNGSIVTVYFILILNHGFIELLQFIVLYYSASPKILEIVLVFI